MPPITVMIKPVSGICNMRCRYCFYADEMKRREVAISPRMSDALLDVTVRRVIRSADSAVHFLFQGGEPTLIGLPFFERLVQLEQKYNTRALRITNAVQTNGYDLSDEMIAFFAKEHFLVGVSLDGTAQTHDLMRPDAAGRPTASVVRKTIERLREAGVSVNVLCVVNGEVARRPSEVFDALAPYEYIQFIPCLDGLDGQTRDYSLSGEAYLAFLKETFDRYHLAYTEGRPVSIRTFDNWIAMLMGMPPENCAMVGRCGPSLVIESDGSVYPCDFYMLDQYKLGNLNTDTLAQIDARRKEIGFIEQSCAVDEKCKICKWYQLCRGGCRRDRDYYQDGIGRNYYCAAYERFFEYAWPKLGEVYEEVIRG